MKLQKLFILAIPFLLASCSGGGGRTSSSETTSGSVPTSTVPPDPLSDEVLIPEFYNSYLNLASNTSGTYQMIGEQKQGTTVMSSVDTTTFKDGLRYQKIESSQAMSPTQVRTYIQYDLITKRDDKFVQSGVYDQYHYRSATYYVDETTAQRRSYDHYVSGLEQPVKFAYYYKSFDQLVKYTIETAINQFGFGEYTQNDYTMTFNKRFNDKGEKEVFFTVAMKTEWLEKQKLKDMPLKSCGLDLLFSCKDNFFTSYVMNQKVSVVLPNEEEMESSIKYSCLFSKDFDETLKNEVLEGDSKYPYPEYISNASTEIEGYLNGSRYFNIPIYDFKDTNSAMFLLKNACFDGTGSIMGLLGSLADQVNVSFKLEGQEFNKESQISLHAYKTYVEISITPKDNTKCFIDYKYCDYRESSSYFAYRKFQLADKSTEYQIETTYEGKQYDDYISYDDMGIKVENGKFDISKLDFAMFACEKYYVEVPATLENGKFECVGATPLTEEQRSINLGNFTLGELVDYLSSFSVATFTDKGTYSWGATGDEKIGEIASMGTYTQDGKNASYTQTHFLNAGVITEAPREPVNFTVRENGFSFEYVFEISSSTHISVLFSFYKIA